ncbi:uncharacterized protein BX664DRAFT_361619 [Halteromyces radiatus]|uniref:uncharacterized protein n=1 Tax=Halteromyces radiatus TaxID=101107 RepID=UPI0022203DBA|nr:uncharacterized protein BX664DRAFT_361619 [Halteromyces radiatus]KAI8081458.1 hypothetical protein BX664DRAFT_361619 [Halteromyces radiatus]
MVKVTYGIRFTKQSPLAQEIKARKRRLKLYMEQDDTTKACKIALDIADLLLSQIDYIDTDLPATDQERDKIDYATEALKFCTKANGVFIKQNDYRRLAQSYLLMIRSYQRLGNYDEAIQRNTKLLEFFKQPHPKIKDKQLLQQSYKLMGDTYFTHGHLGDRISNHTDLPMACKYYEQERKVLSVMTVKDVDGDHSTLTDLMRSSDFNMGVIKGKLAIYQHDQTVEQHLQDAIKAAANLDDVDNERRSWWELGNIYVRRGQWDKALECQKKELKLVKKHGLDDILASTVEMVKTLLELNDYSGCLALCRDMETSVIQIYKGEGLEAAKAMAQETKDIVLTIQSRRIELDQLVANADQECINYNRSKNIDIYTTYNNYNNTTLRNTIIGRKLRRQIATVCESLGQLLYNYSMFLSAASVVEMGLTYVVDDDNVDSTIALPLMLLRIQLLQLKASIHWARHDTSLNELAALNQDIITLATNHTQDRLQQLDIILTAQQRNHSLYHYYGQTEKAAEWHRMARKTENQYNRLAGITKDEEDLEATTDEDNDDNGDALMDKTSSHNPQPLFGPADKASRMTITVSLSLRNKMEHMLVPCEDDMDTLEWLGKEVTRRSWELYGIEPIISHFRLDDTDLFPDDTLNILAQHQEKKLDAIVQGYQVKTLLEVYNNACSRIKKSPLPQIQRVLKDKSSDTTVLSLRGTGLSSEGIDTVIELVHLLPFPLTEINLSGNLLCDDDIIRLFDAIPCPSIVNLNSNLLTFKTLTYFSSGRKHDTVLVSLDLAYNFLGPMIMDQLDDIYQACTNLQSLNVEGCQTNI